MNETLFPCVNNSTVDFIASKKDFLAVTTPAQASALANRVFGDYIIQNTLASAGSNFYYKDDIGFGIYTNTYLKLQFPKFPRKILLGARVDAYNHGSFYLVIRDLNDTVITRAICITYNSYNPDWNWVGENKSGIYLNGCYNNSTCGYKKFASLISVTGHFDIEWNVENFSTCYNDKTSCILTFEHSGAKSAKSLYFDYLEINI